MNNIDTNAKDNRLDSHSIHTQSIAKHNAHNHNVPNHNSPKPSQSVMRTISFVQLWRREWQVKQQGAIQWLYPLVLFLVIITLFPLAVGSEPQLLQRLGVPPCGLPLCCHSSWVSMDCLSPRSIMVL